MKLKTLRVMLKVYAPYILRFLVFLSIVGVIAIFSKYTYDAVSMRNWTSDKNNYTTPNYNSKLYQILNSWNRKASENNVSVITDNNRTLYVDKDRGKDKLAGVGNILPTSTLKMPNDDHDDFNDYEDSESEEYEISLTPHNSVPIVHNGTVTPKVDDKTKEVVCKPEPPKSDDCYFGNRIADRKCCDYIWALQYKKELMERQNCLSEDHGVVGGIMVDHGEYPHMAAVGFKRKNENKVYDFLCGGSLISERFVLTAGHCTKLARRPEYEPEPYMVRLGVVNIMKYNSDEGVDVRIKNITRHPNYKAPEVYYDIALLRLFKNVLFTYSIHPACLSTDLFTRIQKANVTGWGVTQHMSDRGSDHLLEATLDIVEYEQCDKIFQIFDYYSRYFTSLRESQICAGSEVEKVDTCQGDSGGPLQVRINTPFGNIHRVYGVTSSGKSCAIGLPAVYVKVAAVITWIESIVWPEYKTHTNYKVSN